MGSTEVGSTEMSSTGMGSTGMGRRLRAFLAFLYDFVVGDDWRIALGVIVAIGVTAIIGGTSIAAWWILPLAVAHVGTYRDRAAARVGDLLDRARARGLVQVKDRHRHPVRGQPAGRRGTDAAG